MANEKVLISGINYKVRKLIDKYDLLSAENKQLKVEVEELGQQVSALRELLNKKNNEFIKIDKEAKWIPSIDTQIYTLLDYDRMRPPQKELNISIPPVRI